MSFIVGVIWFWKILSTAEPADDSSAVLLERSDLVPGLSEETGRISLQGDVDNHPSDGMAARDYMV